MMRMKHVLLLCTVTLVLKGCTMHSNESQKSASKPNILLILADDMGYGDVSNIGNEYLKTPNLDSMSKRGINFKNFYVSPVCAPTRASLLTGRYHQKVGVRSVLNGYEIMNPNAVTLAEILKQQNYRTAIFGKWHLGEYYPSIPQAQGFDEFLGFRTGHTSNYFDPVLEHNGKQEKTRGYITDVLSDKALDFMSVQSEEPFFCYLAYNAPHSPLQIEEDKFQHFLEMGLNEKSSRVYGMVENIDENMGKIINQLKTVGKLENTIVIFMSDNGPISGWNVSQDKMRFNAGLRDQKFTAYEGGVRTQCYWMWENHWSPFLDEKSIAAHIDVLPTIAGLLDIKLPDSLEIDGIDLSPVMENHSNVDIERTHFEDYNFVAVRSPKLFEGGMARKGKWKMHGGTELYDLDLDPGEQRNLAIEYPDVLKELKTEYSDYYKKSYSKGRFEPLPIKVGYKQENPVHIKSHHGKAAANVVYMGYRGNYSEHVGTHSFGVDGDWNSNWKESGDKITWTVDFVEEAEYEIGITANGRVDPHSSTFNVMVGKTTSEVTLPQVFDQNDWQYIPLLKTTAFDSANVTLQLLQIAPTDSLNINELVITRLN